MLSSSDRSNFGPRESLNCIDPFLPPEVESWLIIWQVSLTPVDDLCQLYA